MKQSKKKEKALEKTTMIKKNPVGFKNLPRIFS